MDATADPAGLRRTATPTEQPICATCPAIHHLIVEAQRGYDHAQHMGQPDVMAQFDLRLQRLRSIISGNTP